MKIESSLRKNSVKYEYIKIFHKKLNLEDLKENWQIQLLKDGNLVI
jgi:hypothetical protein